MKLSYSHSFSLSLKKCDHVHGLNWVMKRNVSNTNVFHFIICSKYLFCRRCCRLFGLNTTHSRQHGSDVYSVRVCFACGLFGRSTDMTPCAAHRQPTDVPNRLELNEDFGRLLAMHAATGNRVIRFSYWESGGPARPVAVPSEGTCLCRPFVVALRPTYVLTNV